MDLINSGYLKFKDKILNSMLSISQGREAEVEFLIYINNKGTGFRVIPRDGFETLKVSQKKKLEKMYTLHSIQCMGGDMNYGN